MTLDRAFLRSFCANVDWLYSGLCPNAASSSCPDMEYGLGGKLLYAGELDPAGCALVVAANIVGAATLAATLSTDAQRNAIRDGVIDFLVPTLQEALHILRNAIRKRETVAVCVSQSPKDVEREMVEIRVLPDLLPPGVVDALRFESFLSRGAQQVDPVSPNENLTVMTWKVKTAPALWLPKLDALADVALAIKRANMEVKYESDGRILNFDDLEELSDVTEWLMMETDGLYHIVFRDGYECKHEVDAEQVEEVA